MTVLLFCDQGLWPTVSRNAAAGRAWAEPARTHPSTGAAQAAKANRTDHSVRSAEMTSPLPRVPSAL